MTNWSESRHNPNFSRFDAVNNKFENLQKTYSERELINLRTLMPPVVHSSLIYKWFYRANDSPYLQRVPQHPNMNITAY